MSIVNIDDYFEGFETKKEAFKARYNKELDVAIKTELVHSHIGSVIIIGSRLGGGKTTLTLKDLFTFMPSLNPIPFIFLSPTHRNSDDAFQTFKMVYEEDWVESGFEMDELKGKSKYCIDDDFKIFSAKIGIPLSSFCELCSYKDKICEFWSKFKYLLNTATPFRGVHAFLGNIVTKMIDEGKYTDVVIDENPKSTMFIRCLISPKAIQRYIRFLVSKMDGYKNEDRYKLLLHLVERLNTLILFIEDRKKYGLVLRSIYDKIREDDLLSIEMCDLIKDSMTNARDLAVRNGKTNGLPRRMDIFDTFSNIVRKTIIESKDFEFFHYSFECSKTSVYLRYCDLSMLQNKMVRTWIIDATTSPVFYKQIFSDPFYDIKLIDDTSIVHNNFLVLQLNDANYGMSALAKYNQEKKEWAPTDKFAEIFDLTCRIIEKNEGKRILIVCRRAQHILQMLYDNLLDRIKNVKIYAHQQRKFDDDDKAEIQEIRDASGVCLDYYSVSRGINYYDGFDVCILFGGAFPNNETLKRESIISSISKDVLVKTQREDEMNQSWGRIRPRSDSIIYVLSSIELGFVNMFNTFKCSVDEMKKFIDDGFVVTQDKIDMLLGDKDVLKHIFLNRDLPAKYNEFRFIEKYIPIAKKQAEETMNSILEIISKKKTGIDAVELKEKFTIDIKDYASIMETKKLIKSIGYKRTLTSKKMKTRIVLGNQESVNFDAFRVQCENSIIDGKAVPTIFDDIIYTARYVLKNSCTITSILKEFNASTTNKDNRSIVESILMELVHRDIFIKKRKGPSYTYEFNENYMV